MQHDSQRWYRGITRYQWIVLIVASLGWVFDVFEGQIFVAAMDEAMPELTQTKAPPKIYANIILGAFLLGGALGGILFGMLSDRIGRTKTLSLTILTYSIFTCFSAFAQEWWHMAWLRFLVAMGVGGEWAVASTLVAEVFPRQSRAWAQSIFHASSVLGTYLAIAAGYLVIRNYDLKFSFELFGREWVMSSWRIAFLLGVVPALLIVWVRMSLRESDRWLEAKKSRDTGPSAHRGRILELFSPELRRKTLVGVTLAAVGLGTFWGVHIYGRAKMKNLTRESILAELPEDASNQQKDQILEEHKKELKNSEMFGMFLAATGGGIGLVLFGPISERIGRKKAFLFYHLGAFIVALIMFQVPMSKPVLTAYLLLFGFWTLGMHAGYAVYFPSLFPTHLRGTGAGFCFNVGRVLAALVLLTRGLLMDNVFKDHPRAMDMTGSILSFCFLLAFIILIYAPETRGQDLPE